VVTGKVLFFKAAVPRLHRTNNITSIKFLSSGITPAFQKQILNLHLQITGEKMIKSMDQQLFWFSAV